MIGGGIAGLNAAYQLKKLGYAQRFPFPATGYYFDGRILSEEEVAAKLRPLAQQISHDADFPGAQNAATSRFLYTEWTKEPFSRGAYTNFKPGQLTQFADFFYIESDNPEERQDVNVGNLVFAGEHLSDELYGFMNGAAQTGRLAAEVVGSRIQESNLTPQPVNRKI